MGRDDLLDLLLFALPAPCLGGSLRSAQPVTGVQSTGFVPSGEYGAVEQAPAPQAAPLRTHVNGSGHSKPWKASDKQRELVLKLVDNANLDMEVVECIRPANYISRLNKRFDIVGGCVTRPLLTAARVLPGRKRLPCRAYCTGAVRRRTNAVGVSSAADFTPLSPGRVSW